MIHEIDSDEALSALFEREQGIVEIRVAVGVEVTLRVPRVVRLVAGWLRLTAYGAFASAEADGAVASAEADGAVASAVVRGAVARAVADGAFASAEADGGRAIPFEEYVRMCSAVTLEDVAEAARWAAAHRIEPGKIGTATRRYEQSSWDCGTTCCVWGGAFLARNGVPATCGPSPEWEGKSRQHAHVASLLFDSKARPEEIEAAASTSPA